jgi:hypothetical protein
VFFRKHPFVRDGLLSIALGISWAIATDSLCKLPEGIICDFSRYLLRMVMWPPQAVSGEMMDLMVKVTGIVPPPPGVETIHPGFDFMVISIAILVLLLYWFLLGGIVCMLWRSVRGRIQNAFAKRAPQVDLGGRGK